jgi:hypothetical protein
MTADEDAGVRCWMCSQMTPSIEYHLTEGNVFDRAACAEQGTPGEGVPLCPSCHTAVHSWMRSHGRESAHPSKDALEAIFTRLISALLPREDQTDTREGGTGDEHS